MSAVPEDVRVFVREQFAISAEAQGRVHLAEAHRFGGYDEMEGFRVACACVMADRAARPSVPPVPDAREEAIREDEREACAKVAEEDYTPAYGSHSDHMEWFAEAQRKGIAGRIRSRRAAERQRLRAETEASR